MSNGSALRNYERILTDSDIWLTMQATAHFLIWTIVLQVLIGFTLAWLINKKFKGNDLWTTIIVLPMMLSPAVVGNFWTFLYQPQIGLFNYVSPSSLLADPTSFSMIGDKVAGAMVDRDRRYLDVDAVCHADLPGGSAVHPRQTSTRRPNATARASGGSSGPSRCQWCCRS